MPKPAALPVAEAIEGAGGRDAQRVGVPRACMADTHAARHRDALRHKCILGDLSEAQLAVSAVTAREERTALTDEKGVARAGRSLHDAHAHECRDRRRGEAVRSLAMAC